MKRRYAVLLLVVLTAVALFALSSERPNSSEELGTYEPMIYADGMFYHQTGRWNHNLPKGWAECGTIAKTVSRTEKLPEEYLVSNCCAEGLRVFSFQDDEGQRKQGLYVELGKDYYRYYDLIDPQTGEYDDQPPELSYTEVYLEGMAQFYGVDTRFTYTPTETAESVESVALHMVGQYIESLAVSEPPRLFTISDYRNLTVYVMTAAEAQDFADLRPEEVRDDVWVVRIQSLEFMGEGVITPYGTLPEDVWIQLMGLDCFQLEKQGDTYTLFSRSAPGEITTVYNRIYD